MPQTYTLRPATPGDYDFMREVKLTGVRPYVDQLWGWIQADQEERFADNFDVPASQIILVDGDPAGYTVQLEEADVLYLAGIYLASGYQGRGIGTAVIVDLLELTHASGRAVRLHVLRPNPARQLYERLGFVRTGETETHVQMICQP